MKTYKFVHDLTASIFFVFIIVLELTMFLLMLYFGVLHPRENTNTILTLVLDILIFGLGTIVFCYFLFFHTLAFVEINQNGIKSKRIFCKKISYEWPDIDKVSIEKITQIGNGSFDGYVFYPKNKGKKIKIFKNKKTEQIIFEITNRKLIN